MMLSSTDAATYGMGRLIASTARLCPVRETFAGCAVAECPPSLYMGGRSG